MIERLMDLLAPASCLECGREGAVLCTTCSANLSSNRPAVCYGCGRVSAGARTCERCLESSALAGVSVGTAYAGAVKELILQLKFHRLRAASGAAVELLMARAGDWPEVDVVTSVPVAAARYRERGYNQSELLARAAAKRLGLPYRSLLGRLTATHQIGLDRRSRLAQVSGAFYAAGVLRGQRVLVIDDVVTTGATLAECAAVLTAVGAGEIWGAAVARH